MDNITHTLVGAALGEAGLKKRTGLAMSALMIGANLPDVDMLAMFTGNTLTFRRGWTHGVLAMVVLPLALTALLLGWNRLRSRNKPARDGPPVRPPQLLLLSAIAVLSHPLLDLLNTYGVRLLMPFSERWFYGDTLFIIDPWVWIALIAGIVVTRRRARSGSRFPARPAQIALVVTGGYVALMAFGSKGARELAALHSIATEQRTPLRVLASPVPANSFRRDLVYDFGDSYRFGRMDWLPAPRFTSEPRDVPTNLRHPAVQLVSEAPDMRAFLYWSRYPFFAIEEDAQPPAVVAGDARFGRRLPGRGLFTLRVPYENGH